MTKAPVPNIAQQGLFAVDGTHLPGGLTYQAGFLSTAEEAHWLRLIRALPFEAMHYKEYKARRRVLSFGGRYDFDENRLEPSADLPDSFWDLRRKVAEWGGLAESDLVHVLFAEYEPGTPLGWHRDVPVFEEVIGVSLSSEAVMRFRPYPPVAPRKQDLIKLVLEPRSIYRLSGAARWDWQHSVAPTPALRYSVTFRTRT